MTKKSNFFSSSIGKKQIMAVSGLMLCGFLVTHLLGNLLIFVGPDAFNTYAYTLTSNPLIIPAEIGLAAIFLLHLGIAAKLVIENRNARPQKYYMRQVSGRGSTFASATMPITGFLILVFIVIHLINFKYGEMYMTTVDGTEMRDLYRLLIEFFQSPITIFYYLASMAVVAIHVSHGLWSALQTFGINHPKYNCKFKTVSLAYGIIVFAGYASFPIYCYMQGAK